MSQIHPYYIRSWSADTESAHNKNSDGSFHITSVYFLLIQYVGIIIYKCPAKTVATPVSINIETISMLTYSYTVVLGLSQSITECSSERKKIFEWEMPSTYSGSHSWVKGVGSTSWPPSVCTMYPHPAVCILDRVNRITQDANSVDTSWRKEATNEWHNGLFHAVRSILIRIHSVRSILTSPWTLAWQPLHSKISLFSIEAKSKVVIPL